MVFSLFPQIPGGDGASSCFADVDQHVPGSGVASCHGICVQAQVYWKVNPFDQREIIICYQGN